MEILVGDGPGGLMLVVGGATLHCQAYITHSTELASTGKKL